MVPNRPPCVVALLGSLLLGCFANTEGTGKGSGKETGDCFQGAFCDPGLQCLLGFCVADEDETGDGNQAVGDGDGDEPGDGDPGDGDPGDGDGDGDPGDGDGDGDEPPPPSCGDGVLDDDEACDGGELGGQSCVTLGWDMGALSCSARCEYDLSGCENEPQPGVGQLYSPCLDNAACPGLDGCATVVEQGGDEPFAGFCSNFCDSDAECAAEVGGTAVPECNNATSPFCHLNCAGGKTCPGGMDCIELVSGSFVCY